MSVRTVTLSTDAYAALSARKKPGESFSDVVRRLAGLDRSPLEFAGAWSDYPPAEAKAFDEWLHWSDRSSREEFRRGARRR